MSHVNHNSKNPIIIAILGAILCFLAVAIGAFGAHALNDLLEQNGRTATFGLANRYHFYHGLALLAVGILADRESLNHRATTVAMLFVVGTLIFCGSLYTLAITNIGWLGAITPLGGLALLAAWAMLAWSLIKARKPA